MAPSHVLPNMDTSPSHPAPPAERQRLFFHTREALSEVTSSRLSKNTASTVPPSKDIYQGPTATSKEKRLDDHTTGKVHSKQVRPILKRSSSSPHHPNKKVRFSGLPPPSRPSRRDDAYLLPDYSSEQPAIHKIMAETTSKKQSQFSSEQLGNEDIGYHLHLFNEQVLRILEQTEDNNERMLLKKTADSVKKTAKTMMAIKSHVSRLASKMKGIEDTLTEETAKKRAVEEKLALMEEVVGQCSNCQKHMRQLTANNQTQDGQPEERDLDGITHTESLSGEMENIVFK